jgi:hypothetical protein
VGHQIIHSPQSSSSSLLLLLLLVVELLLVELVDLVGLVGLLLLSIHLFVVIAHHLAGCSKMMMVMTTMSCHKVIIMMEGW